LRVLGIVLTGVGADLGQFWLVYAPPLAAIAAAFVLLVVAGPGARLARAPAAAEGAA
jgi:hypothetical protein